VFEETLIVAATKLPTAVRMQDESALALDTSVFILPEGATKTSTARVVVLNSIAKRIVDAQRRNGTDYVFPVRGGRRGRLHTSAWKRAWTKAGLPVDETVLKGVHNLRHTFGRRLRAGGVPIETRKLLMGHANGSASRRRSRSISLLRMSSGATSFTH